MLMKMKCVLQLLETYFDFICTYIQTLGSYLKWGSDKTLFDSIFFLNIKKSEGHMQKINVFIIDDRLGKIFKAMNDTILKENL